MIFGIDKVSTGSIISKQKIDSAFPLKELKVILDENIEVKMEDEANVKEMTIDDFMDKGKSRAFFGIYLNLMICTTIFAILQGTFSPQHLFLTVAVCFCIINFIILKIFKQYKNKYGIILLSFSVISLILSYISYTPFYLRQHDARSFDQYYYGGHFGYMGYIFYNNKLPNFSPMDYWCFFNPPLFYIISVFIIKIQSIFFTDIGVCLENLQLMSALYVLIFDIYLYRILKQLKLEKPVIPVMLFVCFAPCMVIMSGSLNNDILSIMLQTMAIFYTIKWYDEDNLKNLIKIAFSIGLAMMTKVSSAIVAIPIAIVFLKKIIDNKNDIKKYIKHFAIFAIIALPIGLWFPIKNLVLYDIPLTYIQSVDLDNEANIQEFSVIEKLFKIPSNKNILNVNVIMIGENRDYNIYIATLKSFIVDENVDYEENIFLNIVVHELFYLLFSITVLYIINIVYLIKNFDKNKDGWIIFFIILLILEIISYIKFCLDFPFVFTMNFRYIVPTLITYAVITGKSMEKSKRLFYINSIALTFFAILSVIMFANL